MKLKEIRQHFINYFHSKNHEIVASSPLIPLNDPTLLFANAGMNQFKDYFTGKSKSSFNRAVSVQKCVRAGGKHNDLENVGFTARHHTFFEMLGNFSFGNYFKEDAIHYAWEFLTEVLKIDKKKLYVTVHHSDDEALKIWHEKIGLSLDRIFKKDKDNFWEMGEFGPCGPCSEIFYDHGPTHATPNFKIGSGPYDDILSDELRYVEIWNLVFMQYEKDANGTHKLPAPSIDTGAGLERIAAALQGKYWNYDTDAFIPLIQKIGELTKTDITHPKFIGHIRVIADHARSSTMLITDGVLPSNEGRGYVLRRIIRRAVRHLNELGVKEALLYKLVPVVFEILGETYPSNAANAEMAEKFLELEEKKFRETLELGLRFLDDVLESGSQIKNKTLSGEAAFKLFDTYGLPLDLTQLIVKEKGLHVDVDAFDKAMEHQKEQSKKSWKGNQLAQNDKVFHELFNLHGNTPFTGYEKEKEIVKLIAKKEIEDGLDALIFEASPFYAESGGQTGDIGAVFHGKERVATIIDTQKPVEGLIIHFSKDANTLQVGERYLIEVDHKMRGLTAKNHTATHLLQSALIKTLGNHIKQSGSSVTPDRLRFDFTHPEKVSLADLQKVEKIVNEQIQQGLSVISQVCSKNEAIEKGAMALFGEKYGDRVRMIEIEDFSLELCGGTHVKNTAEIAYFSIVSESALSSGVRRIEALTSTSALRRLEERSLLLKDIEQEVKVNLNEIIPYFKRLKDDLKNIEKERDFFKDKIQSIENQHLFENPTQIDGGILFKAISLPQGNDLKKLSDQFAQKFPSGLLLMTMEQEEKLAVLVRAGKNLPQIDCGALLKEILGTIGGKGGGRKDMAQGVGNKGIKNLSDISAILLSKIQH